MFTNTTKVLLILPRDLLDRARVLAGQATATFKLPVSLQIVLRALIGEGLKRDDDRALLGNVARQAKAVRHMRRVARQDGRARRKAGIDGLESSPGRWVRASSLGGAPLGPSSTRTERLDG